MSIRSKLLRWLMVLLVAGLALAAVQGYRLYHPRMLSTDQFGEVRVFPAWFGERGFVYVLSGADGWSGADRWSALYYAALGNQVIGIDTPLLLRYINDTAKGCIFMPGLFEDYSRVQQRTVGTSQFFPPLVLGRGSGASLAYLGQIGAPALALGAVVMIDPEPQLPLKPPVCEHPATQLPGGLQRLRPDAFGNYVSGRLWLDSRASPAARDWAASIAGRVAAPAPRTLSLRGLYAAALDDIEAERKRSGVADLPLVEVIAKQPTVDAFAVLYSGDGGWRDLDRSLAEVLAARGLSVVGVDVLRYYWRSKSPQIAGRDLARIIEHYQQHWGRQRVVLIGFSFGADVLPFMVNRLPAATRARIRLITLLSPERTTAFEVTPAGWLGKQADATIPIEPELKQLSTIRLQCVYGEDEAQDSLCTTPAAAGQEIIKKPGGHHFDHNYDELADTILAAAAD